MTQRVEAMIGLARKASARYDSDEVREAVDFLAWLLRGNFVLLGAREYEIKDDAYRCIPGSGLGILADEERSAYAHAGPAAASCREALRTLATTGELLIVDKANARSPVHRHERMDYVGVRRVTPDGEIAGEARLLGLFTTKAYTEPASETPVLHRKLRRVLEAEDLIEGSHDYKSAVALFDTFPKDELFAAPVDDLRRAVVALLRARGHRPRAAARPPRRATGAAPRSSSRCRATATARCWSTACASCSCAASRRATSRPSTCSARAARVRVHFLVHAPDGLPEVANAELEREVVQLARTWDDALRDALVERYGASARAAAALDLGRASARALQGLHRAGDRRDGHRAARAAGRGRPVPGLAAAAEAATRASRSTSAGRRSSWATRCRCSRTSGCA